MYKAQQRAIRTDEGRGISETEHLERWGRGEKRRNDGALARIWVMGYYMPHYY